VRINRSIYAIPRNCLVYVSEGFEGKTANVALRALWPGLEPLSPDHVDL
jgi:hypothetical protein